MKTILVIDDDEDLNEALKDVLELKGYKVFCAFNGLQGLKLLNETQPDLVITDIVMPELDGLGFLGSAVDTPLNYPCKIIAISGGGRITSQNYLACADAFGVDAVLEKPFTFAKLHAQIEALI